MGQKEVRKFVPVKDAKKRERGKRESCAEWGCRVEQRSCCWVRSAEWRDVRLRPLWGGYWFRAPGSCRGSGGLGKLRN